MTNEINPFIQDLLVLLGKYNYTLNTKDKFVEAFKIYASNNQIAEVEIKYVQHKGEEKQNES